MSKQMFRNANYHKNLEVQKMREFHSSQFTWVPENHALVAEISSLGRLGESFKIKSARTGRVIQFNLFAEVKDEGETQMWVYAPNAKVNVVVKIYND
jgi:hypothetical protein